MSLEESKQEALKELELFCEKVVGGPALELALAELVAKMKQLIPGIYDDLIIDAAAPSIKAAVKAALLAEIEKISPLV